MSGRDRCGLRYRLMQVGEKKRRDIMFPHVLVETCIKGCRRILRTPLPQFPCISEPFLTPGVEGRGMIGLGLCGDQRGSHRQHDGSTELPNQLFEHPVSDGAVPVLRQHHQPFDPITGVGNTAIPEFDRKRTAITHYPVVGEDDGGRHLDAWLGHVGSGSLPPSGRDELSGCSLIPHLAEERGERFGSNCGGIENLNLGLRHRVTHSRPGALAENLLDEKLQVLTQPQVLITDEIG